MYKRQDTAESIKNNIDNHIKPSIIGHNPFDIESLFDTMYKSIGKSTRYPVTAIEFALWDIKGKALNVPVYNLLGGKCNEGAPLHGLADRLSIDESIEHIEKLSSEGWTWLKSKIGFDVYAMGGLPVGEAQSEMFKILNETTNFLPKKKQDSFKS